MRYDFKVMQDKEIPLNNKILTLILNDLFNVLGMCCIHCPGAMLSIFLICGFIFPLIFSDTTALQ